jgi:hypothetical protein
MPYEVNVFKLFTSVGIIYCKCRQGDSGGICTTVRNYGICESKQKVNINIGPNINGYVVMGIFKFSNTPSCEPC